MGVGPVPTPLTAHTLRRALERFIRCTAAYFPPGRVHVGAFIRCTAACSPPNRWEAALPRPLQVSWDPAPCLVPHSPALLPRCGCRACVGIAGGPLTPSRPQRTQELYPAYCSVFSIRPRRGHSSVSSTSPPGLYSIPRSLFTSVASSLWLQGPHRHRQWTAHSATPTAHTDALSDALQHVLCPSGGRPPFNNLYISPGGALGTSILVPQRYFLVVGAGSAPTPPVDRAFRCTLSESGRFVRCTVAYFLPARVGTTIQRPLQVPWRSAPRLVPHSLMLLLCYGCGAHTITAGVPRSQRTRELYPMHCSVFYAKSGRVRPSMCSSGKRRSRRRDRVTTRVPGLGHGRKLSGPVPARAPTLRNQTPLDPWRPRVPTLQVDGP
ncbi:hypothetical protein NDU88_002841 [Pleurodeles waltl]|uniref:Uncharacterized protein n=1 Tax=Pleurodeles waltl TaxID=8319 RepID=A0AAV7UYV7_PLEWA|nr:hypothetical protein NDU88_002841 [Pleurodeles waltl]